MPKKRPTYKRKVNNRILILCEGKETEPRYFRGLKRDKSRKNRLSALRIEVYDSRPNTPKELIKVAISLKKDAISENNPYDDIWVVIDKDGYTKHPQAFNQALANRINIAFSSISFEYWFLLHFIYTTKAFNKADDLIKHLKRNYMPNYQKTDDNYSLLRDSTATAIGNCSSLIKNIQFELNQGKKIYELNPYTNVGELVEKLLSL